MKPLNKALVYTVIAVLLGSVTMVVPLALLGPDNLIPADNYLKTVPESDEETIDRNGWLASSNESAEQSADTESYDASAIEPAAADSNSRETSLVSNLSSIGLITVPSFLVALGVFVYLKKRTM
jgi:hypothetical protein